MDNNIFDMGFLVNKKYKPEVIFSERMSEWLCVARVREKFSNTTFMHQLQKRMIYVSILFIIVYHKPPAHDTKIKWEI
jgi:hypothetical protein